MHFPIRTACRLAVAIQLALGLPVGVAAAQSLSRAVAPQPLAAALESYAKQSGLQFVYRAELARGLESVGADAGLPAAEALTRILLGTGLAFEFVNERTVRIYPLAARKSALVPGADTGASASELPLLAQATGSGAIGAAGLSASDPSRPPPPVQAGSVGEVIVTAQKRSERLLDVPVPVSAIAGDDLVASHQLGVQEYFSAVPGLSLVSGVALAIRGITTAGGFSSPTVGITIDDVPYGASNGLAFSGVVPDIDPSSLARIEVLRGPQGTLYGASSLGGLLRYVTVDPSTAQTSGRVQADIDHVENGDSLGYGLRAAVNLPVSDSLAVRISGVTRRDPGYVDDPVRHADGVNGMRVGGGHVSALWNPTESLSLKFGAILQDTNADGGSAVNVRVGSGALLQDLLPGTGGFRQRMSLYTATLTAKFASLDLTSVTGYGIYKTTSFQDFSAFYGSAGNTGFAGNINDLETKKFTQEVRLSSTANRAVSWLVGAFYTDEISDPINQHIFSANPSSGADTGLLYNSYFPSKFSELAGFADITVHFTERFDTQFGGRISRNRQTYDETDSGPLIPAFFGVPSPLAVPTERTKDSAFTYLVTPRFRISPDLMVYARLASGYRPGGPNSDAALFGYPAHFGPDKTTNYEIGVKAETPNHAWSVDASAYYIDWTDIQISVVDPVSFFSFFTNASSAKSEGLELSAQARPTDGLTIAAWLSWNEAVLTSSLPIQSGSSIGLSGDSLPFSSRWSGNLSMEQQFALTGGLVAVVGATASYIGAREGIFAGNFSQARVYLPSYVRTDLKAGVRYGTWDISVFAKNVSDKRGVLDLPITGSAPAALYVQPRTVGLSFAKPF